MRCVCMCLDVYVTTARLGLYVGTQFLEVIHNLKCVFFFFLVLFF